MIDPKPSKNPVLTDRNEIHECLMAHRDKPVLLEAYALSQQRERIFACWIEGILSTLPAPMPVDWFYRVVADVGSLQQVRFNINDVQDILLPGSYQICREKGMTYKAIIAQLEQGKALGRPTISVQLARKA